VLLQVKDNIITAAAASTSCNHCSNDLWQSPEAVATAVGRSIAGRGCVVTQRTFPFVPCARLARDAPAEHLDLRVHEQDCAGALAQAIAAQLVGCTTLVAAHVPRLAQVGMCHLQAQFQTLIYVGDV
jgi:hypothetical protein